MTRSEYRADPCKASSLPYWKMMCVAVPEYIRVLREDQYFPDQWEGYTDSVYFKLLHALNGVVQPTLPDGYELVAVTSDGLAEHIRECYEHERVSPDELREYQTHLVYRPELWLAVADWRTGKIVASGIGELDGETEEGTLEWIQVSPAYRRKGLGNYVVKELLWRMKDRAAFVTVSGRVDNQTDPLALYESCGFAGKTLWHILTENK